MSVPFGRLRTSIGLIPERDCRQISELFYGAQSWSSSNQGLGGVVKAHRMTLTGDDDAK